MVEDELQLSINQTFNEYTDEDLNTDPDDFGGVSDSDDSTSSTTSDDSTSSTTSDDSYDVPGGYVGAVDSSADEDLQSEQVTDVEDEMDGDLDRYSATTTVNEDGSTSFIAESNMGETVEAVTENTPFADEGMNDPVVEGSDITWRQALIGLGAAGTLAVGVYYSG